MSSSLDSSEGETRGKVKVCRQRVHSEIAVIVGGVTKVVFMLVGWVMSSSIPAPFDPYALVYFVVSVVIGAFLTGLVVGFLVQDQRRGAYWGFACAVGGTFFVAYTLGSSMPFPPGPLFFVGYVVFDFSALIGGLIGASISVKMMRIAVLLAVLSVASLAVVDLMFAPTRHGGDLILQADETMSINRVYQQEGNIVVKDNATLMIRNAELIMYQVKREYSIEIRDRASLIVENAKIDVITDMFGQYPKSTIYVKNNATALFNNSDLVSISINASQPSHVTIIR